MAHRVSIPCRFTVEKCMLLPGFSFEDAFPFFMSYGDDTFDLINAKSGRVESLISGSACNVRGQSAVFITEHGNHVFDLDFCIKRVNKDNEIEQCWYQMRFNADFMRMLREYGRLPITSIRESLEIVKENEEL